MRPAKNRSLSLTTETVYVVFENHPARGWIADGEFHETRADAFASANEIRQDMRDRGIDPRDRVAVVPFDPNDGHTEYFTDADDERDNAEAEKAYAGE